MNTKWRFVFFLYLGEGSLYDSGMPTGREITATGQIGEYLTSAELCRLGFIATTFTRNVPAFDILAIGADNQTFPIQVKTIKGSTWQFDARRFLDISFKDGRQAVKGMLKLDNPALLCVFVRLLGRGKDEFFLFRLQDLQEVIFRGYSAYLEKCGGRRPKAPESFHTAVTPADLVPFRDNWGLLMESLDAA